MVPLAILRRDLLRHLRNPVRTVLMFAAPMVLAAIFALVFGGGGPEQVRIKVFFFNEDDGLLSRLLGAATASEQMNEQLEVIEIGSEGFEMMEQGAASALVHVPANFSTDYLAGRPVAIRVVKNPAQRFLPQVVEEGAGIGATVLSQVQRVFGPELQQVSGFVENTGAPADAAVSMLSVDINRKFRELGGFVFPPVVELDTVTVSASSGESGADEVPILAYFFPGLVMMGVLFLAQAATLDILRDRESGLLHQLMTAPVSPAEYLSGKCLSVLVVTSLGFGLLAIAGVAVGIDWGDPAATLLLLLASSLGASGTMLLIMSVVGSERQGNAITTVVIIVWSMIGGAFVPLSSMPSFLRPISQTSPVYWATDGFSTVILEGGGVTEIATNVLVLTVIGLLFMVIGAVALRRRMAT